MAITGGVIGFNDDAGSTSTTITVDLSADSKLLIVKAARETGGTGDTLTSVVLDPAGLNLALTRRAYENSGSGSRVQHVWHYDLDISALGAQTAIDVVVTFSSTSNATHVAVMERGGDITTTIDTTAANTVNTAASITLSATVTAANTWAEITFDNGFSNGLAESDYTEDRYATSATDSASFGHVQWTGTGAQSATANTGDATAARISGVLVAYEVTSSTPTFTLTGTAVFSGFTATATATSAPPTFELSGVASFAGFTATATATATGVAFDATATATFSGFGTVATATHSPAYNILLACGENFPDALDTAIENVLVAMGHTVTKIVDYDSDNVAHNYDLVVVSPSVNSSNTGGLYTTPTPIVTLEGANWNELGIGSAGSSAGGGATGSVLVTQDYITLGIGTTYDLGGTAQGYMGNSLAGSDVVELLRSDANASYAHLTILETGGADTLGGTAPARRGFLAGAQAGSYTDEADGLLYRLIRWAMGDDVDLTRDLSGTATFSGFEAAATATSAPPVYNAVATAVFSGFTAEAAGRAGVSFHEASATAVFSGFEAAGTAIRTIPVYTAEATATFSGFQTVATTTAENIPLFATAVANFPGFQAHAQATYTVDLTLPGKADDVRGDLGGWVLGHFALGYSFPIDYIAPAYFDDYEFYDPNVILRVAVDMWVDSSFPHPWVVGHLTRTRGTVIPERRFREIPIPPNDPSQIPYGDGIIRVGGRPIGVVYPPWFQDLPKAPETVHTLSGTASFNAFETVALATFNKDRTLAGIASFSPFEAVATAGSIYSGYALNGTAVFSGFGATGTATVVNPASRILTGVASFAGFTATATATFGTVAPREATVTATFSAFSAQATATLASAGGSIALVVGDPNTLSTSDQAVRSHLIGLGYSVSLFDDNDATWNTSGYDLCVIAESVLSSNTSWLDGQQVPIITLEGSNHDEFALGTGGSSGGLGGANAVIETNAHPITSTYTVGQAISWSTLGQNQGYISGATNDVQVLATDAVDDTAAVVLALESGDLDAFGQPAVQRRVFLGAQFFHELSADALNIFTRAINWAKAGQPYTPPPPPPPPPPGAGRGITYAPSYAEPAYVTSGAGIPVNAIDRANYASTTVWFDAMDALQVPGKIGSGVYDLSSFGKRPVYQSIYGYDTGTGRPILDGGGGSALYFMRSNLRFQYLHFRNWPVALCNVDNTEYASYDEFGNPITTDYEFQFSSSRTNYGYFVTSWRNDPDAGRFYDDTPVSDANITGLRVLDNIFEDCDTSVGCLKGPYSVRDFHFGRNEVFNGKGCVALLGYYHGDIRFYQNHIHDMPQGSSKGNHVGTMLWVNSDRTKARGVNPAVYTDNNEVYRVTSTHSHDKINGSVFCDVRQVTGWFYRGNVCRHLTNSVGHSDVNALYAKSYDITIDNNLFEDCGSNPGSADIGTEAGCITFKGGDSFGPVLCTNTEFIAGTITEAPMILASHGGVVIEDCIFRDWQTNHPASYTLRNQIIHHYSGGPITVRRAIVENCGGAGYFFGNRGAPAGDRIEDTVINWGGTNRRDIILGASSHVTIDNSFNELGQTLTLA